MLKQRKGHKPAAPQHRVPVVSRDEVARLAFEFYEQRGRTNGNDLDDWVKAEAILRQRGGHVA